jgi:hypothetical protein
VTFADVRGSVRIESVGSGDVESAAPVAMSKSARSARATSRSTASVATSSSIRPAAVTCITTKVTGKVDVPKRHQDD